MKKTSRLKYEMQLIKFSNWNIALMAVIIISIGAISDSAAILLDGAYTILALISDIALLICFKKLEQPANERFQFGYYKLEPLMLTLQGIAILAECKFALVSSIRDIIHPRELLNHLPLAITSQGIICLWALIIALLMKYYSHKLNSNVLKFLTSGWMFGGLQSLFITATLLVSFLLQSTSYRFITPYLDPILTISLVVIFVQMPIKLIKDNVVDLLDMSPTMAETHDVTSQIKATLNNYELKLIKTQLRRAGRKHFLDILCEPEEKVAVYDILILQKELNLALKKTYSHLEVHIILADNLQPKFTANSLNVQE